MRKNVLVLMCVGLAVLFIGCATTSVEPTIFKKEVKIFHKTPQDREFIELGEIRVSWDYDWETVEELLKRKASELGGDAVCIINIAKKQEGGFGRIFGVVDTRLIITAVVIKYK